MTTPPETTQSTKVLTDEEAGLKDIGSDYLEKFGFHDAETDYLYKAPKGLNREIVEAISEYKYEPQWMRDFRIKAYEHFEQRPTPTWGGNLGQIDFNDIHYFVRASEKASRSWDDVPEDIKNTFDRLGIPEAERKFLAGVGAQYESEVVYHQVNEDLEKQGVIFTDMDSGLREHEDLVREHWATVIPPNDNKLAALNSAVWSGGSFVYVPKGVKVEMPLQAYFRINTENMGQFERTLIIAEEGSDVHYIEGCTAPVYSTDSLHSAVVEIIAKPSSRVRYTTVQNWSQNVYNLVTKRAIAQEDATMEWVDCNLGSKLTMKYPSIYLLGEGAHGEILSIAFAGEGQHQDAGGKIIHGGAEDDLVDLLEVDLQGRRPRDLPRPARGGQGRDGDQVEGRLRRAPARPRVPLGHVPDDPHRRVRRERRPRGLGLEDRRGAALLPPGARPRRGGGVEDDRQRVHRADRQGASDGVLGRDEPPDRAPDGGLDWLAKQVGRRVGADGSDGLRRGPRGRLSRERGFPPGPEGEGLGVHRPERARPRLVHRGQRDGRRPRRHRRNRWSRRDAADRGGRDARRPGARAPRHDRPGRRRLHRPQRGALAQRSVRARPAGERLAEPLKLAVHGSADEEVEWRALIVLEEGAEAEVWERYDSHGEGLFNGVVELVLGDGANLRYVCEQELSGRGLGVRDPAGGGRPRRQPRLGRRWASAPRAARCGWRRSSRAAARPPRSPAPTRASATSTSTTTPPRSTPPRHDLRPGLPRRPRRSATAVWRGMIRVDPEAQRTDAFQESRNLLLSNRAHADAIPGLEIEADDVRCTHAAAVAQVDAEQLYYLRSRGLAEADAKSS